MRKLAGLVGAIVLCVAAGACSSSGSSSTSSSRSSTTATPTATPKSGTETITGTVTGAAVAAWLNSTGRTAHPEPPFLSLVFTGLVSTMTSGPMSLRGNGPKTATYTFVTPAGKLVIQRVIKTRGGSPPAVTGQSGSTCYFTQNGGSGAYTVLGSKSSGKFAGATGHGTYTILILAEANLLAGKTVCVVSNTGNVITKGASIMFKASGPLTLKQEPGATSGAASPSASSKSRSTG